MSDPTRTSEAEESTINIDDAISEIQRGYFKKPTFYNDVSQTSSHSSFLSGVNTALNYAGNIINKFELIDSRDDYEGPYRLTTAEYSELLKKAASIAAYSNIPVDICEDFLVILCFINDLQDMKIIADAVQIPELYDINIIRKPLAILAIPQLEKIAFCASALDGLINMFRKYLRAAQSSNNTSKTSDISSILDAIGGIVSGLGGASMRLDLGSAEDSIGNFMSELITGKRIPMNVIAKNPMLQAPSYTGKAFFGESPNSLSLVDVDQIFNKKIAAFPQIMNGAGVSSFGFQNMGSLAQAMPLQTLVAKVMTGSSNITAGSKKERQVLSAVDKINTLIGTTSDETVDIRRADNALPVMSAISTILAGTDKGIFSSVSFQEGWTLANSVSNHLMSVNPNFIEAVRRFL